MTCVLPMYCEATIDFLKKEKKHVSLKHLNCKQQKGHMSKLRGGGGFVKVQEGKRSRLKEGLTFFSI